jgi:enoyl-CoA hydratase
MNYENIVVTREDSIGLVQLNRPRVLNALNGAVMSELTTALEELDRDDTVRCLVVTGSERAFAAGADITEMVDSTPVQMLQRNWIAYWDRLRSIGKPIIAAVSGYGWAGVVSWRWPATSSSRPRRRSLVNPRST